MEKGPGAATGPRFGATVTKDGVRFAVWSGAAERMWVSLFEPWNYSEIDRLEMERDDDGVFSLFVPGLRAGARYGFRADGRYAPERGLWFDPAKMLMDPYALIIDYPYRYNAIMAAVRWQQEDTSNMMPKAIVTSPTVVQRKPPIFAAGQLIYELNVRSFTLKHPEVREELRGTLSALREPVVIDHLKRLGVGAVELMPITACMNERHLQPLGLRNAWGYNPVSFMALDPDMIPGGWAELRDTVAALRDEGLGTILDLVFNHTAESDVEGPTVSLRGLDNLAYYRHDEEGRLVNDTGTGNTVACEHPIVQELVVDSLRAFVDYAGVDGFRFDLATILGRTEQGFRTDAPLFERIAADPILADRVMIAEPWDIGPGGYQLGNFSQRYLEWNDRYRDDIRRFWRGDANMIGTLATRLSGSSDIFGRDGADRTRTVNFVAAHDGMTLADTTAYERKHNEANGEDNRDGHNENFSWNNGVEGESADWEILARRRRDIEALLASLFVSRGTIMLTAGDEFGRTQKGNNNAYAQDNKLTWLDWEGRDVELEAFAFRLAELRDTAPALAATALLTDEDVQWLSELGQPLETGQWEDPGRRRLCMMLANGTERGGRMAILINGDAKGVSFSLPLRNEFAWRLILPGERGQSGTAWEVAGRTVAIAIEE
ncbi:glycogen debranching protein GlgX [Mesorhizobium sp. VNQ89]|uniref:glycogen debranching protein GlgX n=1 Tax=Mesorhizobium quangtriensis TaxID=3157709 RepID=UPI0032B827FC